MSKNKSHLENVANIKDKDLLSVPYVVLPENTQFSLDYDQEKTQEASKVILLSRKPYNIGINKRRQVINPIWGSPFMFPPTVKGVHLKKFHAACARGHVKVLIMGDSIFNGGANLANPQQNPWEELLFLLKCNNPKVSFTDYNMTWGGQTWGQMASTTNGGDVPKWMLGQDGHTSWLELCLNLKPNLVFLYSGGNDGWGMNPHSVREVVQAFQEIGSDVIMCETYQPNTGSIVGDYYKQNIQDGIHYCRRYVTTYAQSYGIGYLPFGRWGDMIRDGFDPETLAMPEVIPQKETAYPQRFQTIPASMLVRNEHDYAFPDIKNMLGVSAASCTDWCIAIEHDGIALGTIAWRIVLSAANTTGSGYDNSLWVMFDRDTIRFKATNAAGVEKEYQTSIEIPRNKWQLWIMARGALVVFAMRLPCENGWVSQNPDEQSGGIGYTKIYEGLVPRCGGPYTPSIDGISNNGETFRIASLGVADATRADGGGHRNCPTTSSVALYHNTTEIDGNLNAGGSNDYHLNNFGVCSLLWPVMAAQEWSALSNTLDMQEGVNIRSYVMSTLPKATNGTLLWCEDIKSLVVAKDGNWYPVPLGNALF